MKKIIFLSFLFLSCIYGCNKKAKSVLNTVFNEEKLSTQIFEINVNKDNTITTKSGCIVKIPAGSLTSDSNIVKLEIKEAIDFKDILLAGLTTMSGSEALSSDGMIYINADKKFNAKINKALEVLVPTKTYNPSMQVFSGSKQDGNKIDWQKPEPLPADETTLKISEGEKLFNANCSNCHKIDEDYTGPSLLGVTDRRTKQWLYDYIKNPAGMMAKHDCNSVELFEKWKPTVMTAFPNLEQGGGIDSTLAYIEAETNKRGLANKKYEKSCCDSCYDFVKSYQTVVEKRNELIEDNGDFYSLDRPITIPQDSTDVNITTTINDKKLVEKVIKKATYYTLKIEAFGWYNIDIFLKDLNGWKESELLVNVADNEKLDYQVNLIIPKSKVFVEGGKLDNKEQYGFYESNGKVNLPQNESCIVVAVAQYKDEFMFAQSFFNATTKQTIDLKPIKISKKDLEEAFSSLHLTDVKVDINKSKNADEIIKTDSKMDSLMKLMPKNCDCGFPEKDTLKK